VVANRSVEKALQLAKQFAEAGYILISSLIYGQMSLMTGHRSGGSVASSTTRNLAKYYIMK